MKPNRYEVVRRAWISPAGMGARGMGEIPSIKGSVFGPVVDSVNKTIASGQVTRNELDRWLRPEDLALLEKSISISSWYPIATYKTMNELLRDVVGNESNDYLREQGRETARRLLEAGLYSQLEYLHRTQLQRAQDPEKRFAAFGRDLRRLATISASILNFSVWTPKVDPDHERRHVIEVSEADDFPEVLCWRSDGFVNEMGTTMGEPDLWGWDRVSRDLVVFRMLRSV